MTVRRIIAVLSTALTIAASAFIWHHLPANTDIYAPFDVHAASGERAVGRGLSATVEWVTITPQLVEPSGRKLAATGTWVVIDATMNAGPEYALAKADLQVGPNSYRPTDRLFFMPPELQPGISDRRGWAFDVAPAMLESAASVVFRVWVGDSRLDSRLVIDVPLTGPKVLLTESLELPAPIREAR